MVVTPINWISYKLVDSKVRKGIRLPQGTGMSRPGPGEWPGQTPVLKDGAENGSHPAFQTWEKWHDCWPKFSRLVIS